MCYSTPASTFKEQEKEMGTTSSNERYEKTVRLVESGVPLKDAVKQSGSSMGTWYKMKKKSTSKVGLPVMKRKYTKQAKFIDLAPAKPEKVAVILCDPHQLLAVLGGLT